MTLTSTYRVEKHRMRKIDTLTKGINTCSNKKLHGSSPSNGRPTELDLNGNSQPPEGVSSSRSTRLPPSLKHKSQVSSRRSVAATELVDADSDERFVRKRKVSVIDSLISGTVSGGRSTCSHHVAKERVHVLISTVRDDVTRYRYAGPAIKGR